MYALVTAGLRFIGSVTDRLPACLCCLLLAACTAPAYREPSVNVPDAHGGGSELALHPDATLLASGGWAGQLRLWQLPGGKAYGSWRAHRGELTGIFFVDNGEALLTCGLDARLVLWDLRGRVQEAALTSSPIAACAVEEGADTVLTGHWDGTVRAWRLSDLTPVERWPLHDDRVLAVAIHPGGWIASGGADGQVYILMRGQAPHRLEAPASDARALAFHPAGRWLYAAGWFALSRWDLATGARQVLTTEHRGLINSIWFTADGSSLASVSKQTDSAVLFLDPHTGATRARFRPHALCGASVRTSGDGRIVVSSAADGSVRIWVNTEGFFQAGQR